MAIRLITGDTFDSVAEAVYDQIRENGLHTGRHIVFVPDQFALMNEMAVLDYLGLKSSFNIEVAGFSRFAHKLIGGDGKIMLNQQTSVMLLQKIILDHIEELTCYKKVAVYSGYVSEIYAVITNLRNSGITPETLSEKIHAMPEYLQPKMRDIALLYREYIKLLATEYTDIGSELEILASRIATDESIRNAHIYVVDFHDLSKVKLNILAQCIQYCQSFTIGVVDCPNAKNARIYPRYLTDFVRAEAQKLDLPVHESTCQTRLGQDRSVVADRIFSHYLSTDIVSDGTYQLRYADDVESEVKGIAREIRRMVVDEHMRYRDIAICVSDLAKYKSHIAKIFRDFEIPYYLDNKTPLVTTGFVRALLTAIDVVAKRYRRGEVMSFVKCGLLGLTEAEVCIFERFCDKFNINYSRFTSPFEVGKDTYEYAAAEKVRGVIVRATAILKVGRDSVRAYIENIKTFYRECILPYYPDYLKKVNKLDPRMHDVATMAVEKVMTILDQIVDILEEGDYSGQDVCNMLRGTFESVQISTVPQYVDSMFVGEMGKSKYMGVKVVILMGAQNGTYPAASDVKGLIRQEETRELERVDIKFFPDYHQKLMLDKFYVEQLLLTASDRVIVSYHISEERSIMVDQLSRILNISTTGLVNDKNVSCENMLDYAIKMGTKSNAKLQLMGYYSELKRGLHPDGEEIKDVYDYLYGKVGEGEVEDYLAPKYLPKYVDTRGGILSTDAEGKKFSSVSAVESFFKCPFMHFCDKELRLKPIESGDMSVMDMGSFVHRVLELMVRENVFLTEQEDKKCLRADFDQLIDGYVDSALVEKEFEQFSQSFKPIEVDKLLKERCRFSARKVAQCMVHSDYDQRELEFSFGSEGDELPPLEIKEGERKYYIRGRIDRLDKSRDGKHFVVIDYKTSKSVGFGLEEIYYGQRLQLLLYTKAYMRDHDIQPLAVYYLPLPYKYDKEETGYKYAGVTEMLPSSLADFDHQCDMSELEPASEERKTRQYSTPVFVTEKKGELVVTNKSGRKEVKGQILVDKKGMNKLLDYAERVMVNALREMEHGYIEAKPIKCDFCNFAGICRVKDMAEHKRVVSKVSLQSKAKSTKAKSDVEE